ncbi:ATP-grasp peptide maturase system methyltransferase [Micromonospora sp. NPDC050695]|uniref:ATP-grasp peptide maturase system methyltransferase n=1 Tax=Micromonospora sp. NPDC050695 TaxID=3154938 RepID=UPI0033C43A47
MTLTAQLRQHLVDTLTTTGVLTDRSVTEAFAAVPRHHFAPAVYRVSGQGQIGDVLDGADLTHAGDYLSAVYSDEAIVTQIAPDGRPTSSSTQPGVMAVMLQALDLAAGMTVLEVGTGTGYNAALLSQILGSEQVTSVDIDAGLVDQARVALAAAGYRPRLAAADGLSGYRPSAPYDRIIATCSVRRVPAAWLRQTKPGGLVMANMSYGVVPLRVRPDGSGEGRFLSQVCAFIEARPADGPLGPTSDRMIEVCMGGEGATSAGTVQQVEWFAEDRCEFFWRLSEPSVYQCTLTGDMGKIHCLVDAGTDSWARVHHDQSGVTVVQGGSRRVWDDIMQVCQRWDDAGRPGHYRLGLTVSPEGHHVLWVDRPDGAHRWPLR